MLYSRSLLIIYLIYSRVCMSFPISQFIPPSLLRGNYVGFLHLWLYFSFVDKFICTIFEKDFLDCTIFMTLCDPMD